MNINLLQLRYFYVVAQEASFTRAAQKLRIAQPALSQMIKQLETNLGKQLLLRSRKEITLTAHGRKAWEYSRTIFESATELEKALKVEEISPLTPLRIGTTDALAAYLLPEVMEGASETLRSFYPVIQTGNSQEICALLERRSLDLALLFHLPELSSRLHAKDFFPVRFHLVVAKEFKTQDSTLNAFIGSREVEEEGAHRFPTLSKWKKIRPEAQIRYSSNSHLFHLELVKRGLGIAVLPSFLVQEGLRRKTLLDLLPRERLLFSVKLVAHRDLDWQRFEPVLPQIKGAAKSLSS